MVKKIKSKDGSTITFAMVIIVIISIIAISVSTLVVTSTRRNVKMISSDIAKIKTENKMYNLLALILDSLNENGLSTDLQTIIESDINNPFEYCETDEENCQPIYLIYGIENSDSITLKLKHHRLDTSLVVEVIFLHLNPPENNRYSYNILAWGWQTWN